MRRAVNDQARDGAGSGTPARPTPYELVFATEEFEARIFPAIREDAARRGLDPLYPDQFNFVPAAAEAVRDVLPSDAPAEALEQYRLLLFHAFNLWRFGRRIYLVERPVARFLVEAAPAMAGWELVVPHPSQYVQLPANLFWGSISPDSTPEPLDGFFVTAAEGRDGFDRPFHRLEILVVMGVRRDRAGFSVIPFDTEAGPGIAAAWAATEGRDQGADFANILPGGEMSGLYSVVTSVEVLKLLGRVLWYVDLYPGAVAPETVAEAMAAGGAPGLPAPRVPYFRVSLDEPGTEEE